MAILKCVLCQITGKSTNLQLFKCYKQKPLKAGFCASFTGTSGCIRHRFWWECLSILYVRAFGHVLSSPICSVATPSNA